MSEADVGAMTKPIQPTHMDLDGTATSIAFGVQELWKKDSADVLRRRVYYHEPQSCKNSACKPKEKVKHETIDVS